MTHKMRSRLAAAAAALLLLCTAVGPSPSFALQLRVSPSRQTQDDSALTAELPAASAAAAAPAAPEAPEAPAEAAPAAPAAAAAPAAPPAAAAAGDAQADVQSQTDTLEASQQQQEQGAEPQPPQQQQQQPQQQQQQQQQREEPEEAAETKTAEDREAALKAVALSRVSKATSSKDLVGVATALSSHLHSATKAACGIQPSAPTEPSELTELLLLSRQCRHSSSPVLVVDGGSTGTRGVLFRVMSESCFGLGRRVLPESLRQLEEGPKFEGLRQLMEKWLDEAAGPGWASRAVDSHALLQQFPRMRQQAGDLLRSVLRSSEQLVKKYFSEYEQEEAKTVGIPVIFFSTAGVRDTHDWYRRGLFASFIEAINSYSSSQGFVFFTNEEWTRPIPGVEEGMLAFVAANQLLGRFARAKQIKENLEKTQTPAERKQLETLLSQTLTSIVEVGGASAQIVFPVYRVGSSPSFVNTTNLTTGGYLSSDFPSVDIMSTSYMQLGASSATGIFYKSYCSNPDNLRNGVCLNPCLPKGYQQECSTGDVSVSPEGAVAVSKQLQRQRLKPAAYYCTSTNDEIAKKALNRLSCIAAGINPEQPLEERLAIEGCSKMEGTGDFAACAAAVSSILLDPPLPLPANQEASYTGFDTVGQIFDFMSTEAPIVITGKALVFPIRDLQKLGLLKPSFQGDPCELKEAATKYCSAPVVRSASGALVRQLQPQQQQQGAGGGPVEVTVSSVNLENCFKLGMSHGLLRLLNKSNIHPSKITFAIDIEDPNSKQKVGEYGWPPGAILRAILNQRKWSTLAYELGKNHTVRDRWNAAHSASEQQSEENVSM